MRLGFLAFANNKGLGIQSKRLAELLKPDRVLVIDSRGFSNDRGLHMEWYDKFQTFKTENGFPSDTEIDAFLQGLTHVLMLENPYNFYLPYRARQLGIKTICQSNYEFAENVEKPYLPVPDLFLMPSYWKMNEMESKFTNVRYLPPPIDVKEFEEVRKINFKRKGKVRFLHIMGTLAYKDRNGTLDLLKAVKLSKSKFELVIKTQHEVSMNYFLDDKRVTYEIGNAKNNADLYKDFDVLLLPRRYGGLSLTTNEALMAGMPVVMTNIYPNNKLLPKEWLVKSYYKSQIVVKTVIDVYSADHEDLARTIDFFCRSGDFLRALKGQAFDIGRKEFSFESLRKKYSDVFDKRQS